MSGQFDQPPFVTGKEGSWGHWDRSGPVAPGDEVRVVLHGDDAAWIDPVFDARPPQLIVVTVRQVARTRLLGWRCGVAGHVLADAPVVVGIPVGEVSGTDTSTLQGTVRLRTPGGGRFRYVLEQVSRKRCLRCDAVPTTTPSRGVGMTKSPSPLPVLGEGRRWRWRIPTPWHPAGPLIGIVFVSVLTIVAGVGVVVCLALGDALSPWWLLGFLALAALDVVVSSIAGGVRSFLEECGGRFGATRGRNRQRP